MADTLTACQRLQEADEAYHGLMLGQAVRSVTDENGETLTYTAANRDALLAYIRQLAPFCTDYIPSAIAHCYNRPMRFLF